MMKYVTLKLPARTGRCQCCGTIRNALALYRSPTLARACRDCALLDWQTEPMTERMAA